MARSTKALRGEIERCQSVAEAIRVPTADWQRILTGRAREFRLAAAIAPKLVPVPTLAILYHRDRPRRRLETRLMFVEAQREEPLGAITEDGLKAAGYDGPRDSAYPRFRREWKLNHRKFEPLQRVAVFTIRPIAEGDIITVGKALVEHLYGDHLATAQQTRTVPLLPEF